MDVEAAKLLAIGLLGGGAFGFVAVGEGLVAAKAMEAIGRNPEIGDYLIPRMILAMAICESTAIYALVLAFYFLFAL